MDFRGPGGKELRNSFPPGGPGLGTDGNVCRRGPAPIETFTRSQLAAISSIFIDFHDFHRFSEDFMRLH